MIRFVYPWTPKVMEYILSGPQISTGNNLLKRFLLYVNVISAIYFVFSIYPILNFLEITHVIKQINRKKI